MARHHGSFSRLEVRGHRQEQQSEPFTGPINAISRIFLEQWIAFHGWSFRESGFVRYVNPGSHNPSFMRDGRKSAAVPWLYVRRLV